MEMGINPLLVHEEGKGTTVTECRIILMSIQREYSLIADIMAKEE
jgi:hypothetical protein